MHFLSICPSLEYVRSNYIPNISNVYEGYTPDYSDNTYRRRTKAPERRLVDLLEHQESVASDKPVVREMPGPVNIPKVSGRSPARMIIV